MKVIFSPRATRQLDRLPANEGFKIIKKLKDLETTPFTGKLLTGKLKGLYSLRAWPYRIVYEIFKDRKIVLIDTIEHRQGVYK